MALPFELLSRVERELERVCREQDPMAAGYAVEDMASRCRYEIGPVHAVAWITRTEPEVRLLTVVEVVFPDKPAPDAAASSPPSPIPAAQETGRPSLPVRTVYPRRPAPEPAGI